MIFYFEEHLPYKQRVFFLPYILSPAREINAEKSLFCIFLHFFLLTDNFCQFGAVPLQRNKKNGRYGGKFMENTGIRYDMEG